MLKKQHAIVSLLATIIFSIAATYFSCRLANITDDQRKLQELSVRPLLVFECRPSDRFGSRDNSAVDLIVENVGGPINRLTIEYSSLMSLRISTPGKRDTVFAFVPLHEYFGPISATYRHQGVVATAEAATLNAAYASTHAQTVYDSIDIIVRPGRVHHLVHLSYQDGLRRPTERFVILNERDYWDVRNGPAIAVIETLNARWPAGRTLSLEGGMTRERILSVGRALRPVLRRDHALMREIELDP